MARLSPDMSRLDERQTAFLDAIVAGKRGQSVAVGASHGPPNGLFGILLMAPEFGQRMQSFGAHVRYDTSLAVALSELAILVCARHWGADYEYWAHSPIAREGGLGQEIIDAIRDRRDPPIADPREAAVYRFSQGLLTDGAVSDDVFRTAHAELGTAALIELVGVIGYYSLVALMVKAFQIDVPDPSYEPLP